MKFTCKHCKTVFEGESLKKEYLDQIYGACFKYVSLCPDCKAEADEYRAPKVKSRNSSNLPSCGMNRGGGCACCG